MSNRRSSSTPASPREAASCSRPIDRLLVPELFKALCDPTRASLLACLAKCCRPCSVGEIAACCSVHVSVVSRHLAQLERAGAIRSARHGRAVLYQVCYSDLSRSLRRLADAIDACGAPAARAPPSPTISAESKEQP